ncbi:acetyltransferase [Psychroflexus sp. YR1-1]|uniref:Acetyltransferase n=1 Tax=Psychroflexus aurantiacus TaxID=2709310 RepID=A0A6B3QY91_9FLAO|nr:acetyltransferase [Psychroflexus aurantiacus]NEV92722.1 acetyltransferase [Psychroflexus aurantiacus]
MKGKIAIIGAGGFGREVKMLIDQINEAKPKYDIIGFYDDDGNLPNIINGLPYLGSIDDLTKRDDKISIALGIGVSDVKKNIIKRLENFEFKYPTLIHPNVWLGKDDVTVGKGCVICANTVITCNIKIRDFVTLNLSCTVGHDTEIKSFSSFMPSVNISGEVIIEERVYVGTGAKIINQLQIGENTIVGAGAVVAKSLPANCTAVGIPAKPIKFHS